MEFFNEHESLAESNHIKSVQNLIKSGASDKPCGDRMQSLTPKTVAKRYMIAKKLLPVNELYVIVTHHCLSYLLCGKDGNLLRIITVR